MVEGAALEMRCTRKGTVGSNPTLSAFGPPKRTYGVTQSAKATFVTLKRGYGAERSARDAKAGFVYRAQKFLPQ